MTQAEQQKISAVMPLTVRGDRSKHVGAYVEVLLDTLSHFWSGSYPLDIHIICPDAELSEVYDIVGARKRLNVLIKSESQIVPEFARFEHLSGWFKQMIIKLAIADTLDTEYYITLDSDIACVRIISPDMLLPGGRALTELESVNRHSAWWWGSRSLLKAKESAVNAVGLSVTPNILSRTLARRSIERIAGINGVSGIELLCSRSDHKTCPWTEYTLYTEANWDRLSEFHWLDKWVPDGQINRLHTDVNVWSAADHGNDWDPVAWVRRTNHGFFVVYQSSTLKDPSDFIGRMRELMETQ